MSECGIFVINIEKSIDRAKHIQEQFEALDLNFHLFAAVDGRAEDHYLFKKYNNQMRLRIKGKALEKSQLGCYASHFLLWEKCVSLNHPIMILEDDALINRTHFKKIYQLIKNGSFDNYECIRLFQNPLKKHKYKVVEKINDYSVIKYLKGPMGTVGYYVTPAGANKLIQNSEEWIFPVDIFMDRFWEHKVECYGILPNCLDHNRDVFYSIVSGDDVALKRTLKTKILRELFTSLEFFKRIKHNVIYLLCN